MHLTPPSATPHIRILDLRTAHLATRDTSRRYSSNINIFAAFILAALLLSVYLYWLNLHCDGPLHTGIMTLEGKVCLN